MTRRKIFERTDRPGCMLVTPTDLEAVRDVGRFRFMTSSQLLQLRWPRPSQRRHGESRLRELYHAGWLERQPLWIGRGRPSAVYSLGPIGRQYLAEKSQLTRSQLGLRPAKEAAHQLLFLEHHLLSVQALVNLEVAAKQMGGAVSGFQEERLLRAAYLENRAANPVIPDGYLELAIGERCQSFCLELDRATVGLRFWRSRVRGYWRWAKTPRFRTELGNPVVLILVAAPEPVGRRRVAELKLMIEAEAGAAHEDASLFWLTELGQTSSGAALARAIWLVGGQRGNYSLVPEDGHA